MASNSNLPQSHSPAKKEKTFDDILQTISRGKKVLVISFITIMAAVFLFNTFVKPKYDSAVILKKEKVKDRSLQDQLQDMVQMQSLDEIETEIEIVTTKDVITRVVDELSLNVNINKVISNGNITDINKSIIDYNHDILSNPFYAKRYPRFSGIRSDHLGRKGSFYIQKNGSYNYQLFNSQDNTLIAESKEQLKPVMQKDSDFIDSLLYPGGLGTENEKTALRNLISFEIPQAVLDIEWPDSKPGDKFYFDLKDYSETVDELTKEISVKRKAKTDLFEIRVISSSPYSAKIMANTVADKFREVRLDHQRQTIRGSFNFVDKQIKEMFEKLNKADAELTRYKTQGKITSIDDNSKNLINFLGNLEAEKVKTELELSDYQNKYQSMKGELSKNGYFDQTFLTPEKTDQAYSPFSNLQRQLSDLELQRIQLLQKRKETHPDVIMIDNQIKQVKEKMGNYNQNTLTAYQIIINTAQKKRQELMDLSEKYNSKIKELPGQESRLAELTRNKNVYERIFVLLLDKREEMRMAEVSRLQDIVMVESAVTNTVPVFPDKRMNYLAGLLLSLVMGLFVIFLIEFIRRKKDGSG